MTALVTGAAGGIGRAIAARLAADGHCVAVCDRDAAGAEETAALVEGAFGVFDIGERQQVREGVAALVADVGPIDVLVSNAGIVDQIHPALEFDDDGWERELRVNLSGAFWCCQEVCGGMAERGFGRVVVISSGAAEGGLPGQVAYAASKAGLLGMVRTLAVELGRSGVTVNAVLPGLIGTEKVMAMPEKIRAAAVRRTALGRVGEMDEVAALVSFLASDGAGYLTGACIPIDGGGGLNTLALAGVPTE
jgi:NAD(P)-dependent dehydrogenase (short-subunit alcohol dehydrogenase family)